MVCLDIKLMYEWHTEFQVKEKTLNKQPKSVKFNIKPPDTHNNVHTQNQYQL